MTFKSGYVAIVGRPNVGKSTLMNAILGEKLSIVTPKAQTTRHRIVGILNTIGAQIVFLDTPGWHMSEKPLNQVMNEIVDRVIDDADCVCLMVEADLGGTGLERGLFDKIGPEKCVVVVNKADKIDKQEFDALAKKFRDEWGVKELAIISALKNEGVAALIEAIKERMPEGKAFYPDDIYTEHPVRFLASEYIREELFLQMHQELPYSSAVVIDEFRDATDENPVTRVAAFIIVEKDSQKAMVIGKGGSRIKEIGTRARKKIEGLVGGKVFLELNVRVEKNWTKDRETIKKLRLC